VLGYSVAKRYCMSLPCNSMSSWYS